MVAKKIRNTAIKVVVAGGIIAGVAILADKADLGSRIIQSAKDLGATLGKTITGIPQGIIAGTSEGAGDLGNSALKAGADFQEFVGGDRDFLGKLFEGLFNGPQEASGETPGLDPNQPDNPTVNNPGTRSVLEKVNFSNILSQFKLGNNENIKFDQPQSIGTKRNVGLNLSGVRGVVDTLDALGVRGKVLPVNAVSRRASTLQGQITTATGGTRNISGSAALFERIQQNANR